MERKIRILSDDVMGPGFYWERDHIETGSEIGLRCLVDSGMAEWADEPVADQVAAPAPPAPAEATADDAPTVTSTRKRAAG